MKYKTNDLPSYLLDNKDTFANITEIIESDSIIRLKNAWGKVIVTSSKYGDDYEIQRKDNYEKLQYGINRLNIAEVINNKNISGSLIFCQCGVDLD